MILDVLCLFFRLPVGPLKNSSLSDRNIHIKNMGICGSEEANSYKALTIRKSHRGVDTKVGTKDVRKVINETFDRFDFNHDGKLDFHGFDCPHC